MAKSLRFRLSLTALAAAVLLTAAPVPRLHAEEITPAPIARPLPDFVALVKQVKPAVVSITSKISRDDEGPQAPQLAPNPFGFPFPGFPFGQLQPQRPQTAEARGSGFIIDADGTVVTNNHVVRGATSVTVTLDDGTTYPAKILGKDKRTDLAVLKITAKKPLPFIVLGDSDLAQPGSWVVAVGNPFGLGGSVTAGIVSARNRDIGEGPYDSFIQVDAPINQGNSGGPLFTQDGRVVGVNTAIISPSGGSVGIGFAIPANTVKTVVAQLKKSGKVTRGYIGVQTQGISAAVAGAMRLPESATEDRGALVASVEPDAPAAKAGVQPGDAITAVNGKKVANPRELAIAVAAIPPGDTAVLSVVRDGKPQTVKVTVGTLAADAGQPARDGTQSGSGLGVNLSPITPQLRQQLNIPESTRGAVITEMKPGSAAEQAGLQPGDVIIAVGDKAVSTPSEAARAVRSALAQNQAVALRILRNGEPLFVGVQVGAPAPGGNNDDDEDR